jgi:hypothetical protein
MDTSGFDDLPRAYRLGLSLQALGADDQLIAECVGVDVDSVGALLDIGARKLEHVRDVARLRNIGREGSESSSAGAVNNHPNNKGQSND